MNKTNYALISALYANSKHGLYSDIYFPIIKYSIVCLFSKLGGSHPYCSAEIIHDFIFDRFGISIPHIVISSSVLKIHAQGWPNMELEVYEGGETLQIHSASFDNDDEDFDEREKQFASKITCLEDKYKVFLKQEGSVDDGISFIQFITDNTDDILGYFEQQDTNKVDQKYATMVFFLQYLSDYEKELYQVANQLFWGSVIAGFLKSQKPQIDVSEDGIRTEYFLDTSIVMGLLKLSTPQHETYSQEVCDIIKSSGGLLRVNPMTVDEVSFILQSVEQNGPNPLTPIASACERYGLEANELAQTRLRLSSNIEKKGVVVFPNMSVKDKQDAVQSYKGKNITKLLGESRSNKPASYNGDNYREIHDVYMDDYIKNLRKKKKDDNHVFFLTANRDLISFCKTMHPETNYMKSTGQVILELWMHNTKPVDISGCLLTETMAKCLDMHSSNVRNKIAEVSRLYNKTAENFDAEVYKEFIKKLYSRAKNVIQTVERESRIVEGEFGRLIKEAVAADNLAYNKEAAKVRDENVQLNADIAAKNEELESKKEEVDLLTNDNKKKQEEIISLTKDRDRISSELESKEKERKRIEKEKEEEIGARKRAERINYLYKKREELMNNIKHKEAEISPYEESLKKAFCNWLPILFFTLAVAFIIALVVLWIIASKTSEPKSFFIDKIIYVTIGIVSLAGIMVTVGLHLLSKDSIELRKATKEKKWLESVKNRPYKVLKSDLDGFNKQLESIEKELKTIV